MLEEPAHGHQRQTAHAIKGIESCKLRVSAIHHRQASAKLIQNAINSTRQFILEQNQPRLGNKLTKSLKKHAKHGSASTGYITLNRNQEKQVSAFVGGVPFSG